MLIPWEQPRDDNIHVRSESLPGPTTKGVLTTVGTLALLLSGFFWLGYWTAELEGRAQPEILYWQPLESKEADAAQSSDPAACEQAPQEAPQPEDPELEAVQSIRL